MPPPTPDYQCRLVQIVSCCRRVLLLKGYVRVRVSYVLYYYYYEKSRGGRVQRKSRTMPRRKAARDTCHLLADTEGPQHWGWSGVTEKRRRTFLTKVDTFFSFFFFLYSPCVLLYRCVSTPPFVRVLRSFYEIYAQRTTKTAVSTRIVAFYDVHRRSENFASVSLSLRPGVETIKVSDLTFSYTQIQQYTPLALSVFGSVYKLTPDATYRDILRKYMTVTRGIESVTSRHSCPLGYGAWRTTITNSQTRPDLVTVKTYRFFKAFTYTPLTTVVPLRRGWLCKI